VTEPHDKGPSGHRAVRRMPGKIQKRQVVQTGRRQKHRARFEAPKREEHETCTAIRSRPMQGHVDSQRGLWHAETKGTVGEDRGRPG